MTIIQKGYIFLLQPFAKFNNERNRALRYFLIGVCFFVVFGIMVLSRVDQNYLQDDSFYTSSFFLSIAKLDRLRCTLICGALLLLALFLGVEKKVEGQSWNWYLVVDWAVLLLLFLIAGLTHDIGEGLLPAIMIVLTMIPAFYIVWESNGKLAELFDIVSVSILALTFVICMADLVWFKFGDVNVMLKDADNNAYQGVLSTLMYGIRYHGIMIHINRLAEILAVGMIASLYLIYRGKGALPYFSAITIGLALAQLLMTISRTFMLSAGLAFAAWLIFYFRGRKSLKTLGIVVVIASMSFAFCYTTINHGQDNLMLFSAVTQADQVYADEAATTGDEENDSLVTQRFKLGNNANALSSGRLGIWQTYLKRISLTGNDIRYAYPLKVPWPSGSNYFILTAAHNVAMEYAYRCGAPAGIAFLILEILAFIFCIICLFMKPGRFKDEYVFAVMGILAFLVGGNLEPLDEVFDRIMWLVFFLACIPVFRSVKRDKAKNEK